MREGLGNDVFTFEHEHLHEMKIYFSMTNMYICMRWQRKFLPLFVLLKFATSNHLEMF